ncbi:MAG: hypothetical protein JO211_13280, partial [Acidobacteriaceae bacterium]|nr:hypothetical protein [Acidobacteriaceae bacterium]
MTFKTMLRLFFGLMTACAALSAQSPTAVSKLDERVKTKLQGFPGKVSLYAKNLDTGLSYGIDAEAPVRTAST